MRVIDAAAVTRYSPYTDLIEALRHGFAAGCKMPKREHYTIAVPGGSDATLLTMPAWRSGAVIGVKLASVFPDNGARGLQAVQASYILMDGTTGVPLALIDGGELTARRTVATSVLAADYLARSDARRLLIAGTGRIARYAGECYAAARPALREIVVWGRDGTKAGALAGELAAVTGCTASAAGDLEQAAHHADIISCATLSREPLIRGEWLPLGAHLDLIGGFTPQMREADDEAVRRARVFADNPEGALSEAGDLIAPLASGALARERIAALASLCRGAAPGRVNADEITLFKAVGSALADLFAAELIWQRASS